MEAEVKIRNFRSSSGSALSTWIPKPTAGYSLTLRFTRTATAALAASSFTRSTHEEIRKRPKAPPGGRDLAKLVLGPFPTKWPMKLRDVREAGDARESEAIPAASQNLNLRVPQCRDDEIAAVQTKSRSPGSVFDSIRQLTESI